MSTGQGVGAGVGFVVGSYWGAGYFGMSIGYMIGGWIDPPKAPNAEPLGDLSVNSYVRNYPLSIVYGVNKVYGGVIWLGDNYTKMENEGSSKSPSYTQVYYADFAVAASEGPINGYLEYFLNDDSLDDIDESDLIDLDFYPYYGTEDQTTNSIIESNLAGQTADGLPFIYTAYNAVSGKIGTSNSLPTFSAEVDGILTESGEKDANPVKVIYDLLTNVRYGAGLDISLFDGSPTTSGSWKEASDFCDVLVDDGAGSTQPRFRYSIEISSKTQMVDILEDILLTCRGFIYFSEGVLKIKLENNNENTIFYFADRHEITFTVNSTSNSTILYSDFSSYPDNYWMGDVGYIFIGSIKYYFVVISQTSSYINIVFNTTYSDNIYSGTFTLNKQNIKRDSFSFNVKATRDIYNRIRIEFINRDDDYRTDVVEEDDVYDMDQTNEIRENTISTEGIKRKAQAQRLAKYILDVNSLVKISCEFETDTTGYFLEIGDIIGITHAISGWNKKLFRIVSLEEGENLGDSKLSCTEYIPGVYHDYGGDVVATISYSLPNKYEKPSIAERFIIKEDTTGPYLYLMFKRPDNNPWWSGVSVYIYENSQWNYIFNSSSITPSVALSTNVNSTDTTIYYDNATMYESFPETGSFWIDNEEIYYGSIDTDTYTFLNCERGYNNTEITAHTAGVYIVLRNTSIAEYTYDKSQIGSALQFKIISYNLFGMNADSSSSPTQSIIVEGYYYSSNPISMFQLNSQGNGNILNIDEDAILTWYPISEVLNNGYGCNYGDLYGYASLTDIYEYIIEIYDQSDNLLRTEEITDTSIFTYTYDSSTNISDNGGTYNENLIFKIYQVNTSLLYSIPKIIITNS